MHSNVFQGLITKGEIFPKSSDQMQMLDVDSGYFVTNLLPPLCREHDSEWLSDLPLCHPGSLPIHEDN